MKVLLGLSGGVDSAVAAYLLKRDGYDVTCLFMRNWDSALNNDLLGNPTIEDYICPQEKDYNDAKSVAESLGLPILRVDFIKEYWDYVFESFLSEYKKGRTPNPDILCNKYIKFASFFDYAMKHGFDYVAMGHYAKVIHEDNKSYLYKGDDDNKDQSYFLCQIPYNALQKTLFPLANINKSKVREIAQELNLSIANKKDSTGICFIGERNFKEFLNNYLPAKQGEIIDINSNEIVGKHTGVLYYTIGQRKGLGIGGPKGPYVVIDKDIILNRLYVASIEDDYWLYSNSCKVVDINWLTDLDKNKEHNIKVKFRYRQKDQDATIKFISDNQAMLFYPQNIPSVTIGQSAVFYQDRLCLGGGIIDITYSDDIDKKVLVKEKLESYNG